MYRIAKSSTVRVITSRATLSTVAGQSPYQSHCHWQDNTAADSVNYAPSDVFRAGVRHHHICNTAFPIAHNTTIRPYRVPRTRDQAEIRETLAHAYGPLDKMMLYVHVPFCETRCQFCEYTVVDPKVGKLENAQDIYFDALMREFQLYDEIVGTRNKVLAGFDIGGGTPSMASIAQIGRIMDAAHKHFKVPKPEDMHISIETTPKIAARHPEKIKAYYDMGIRRISMGMQTTDFRQAKELGRDDANASTDYLQKAVDHVRAAGFTSFNIDLMYGFPLRNGREDPWADTVQDTINLRPEHITLYRMRYKGTKMSHLADRVQLKQVNEQEAAARQLLEQSGYQGMVGKNTYSKVVSNSGCSDYLDLRVRKAMPYLGFGLGAQSFSHHTLAYNLGSVTKKMSQYLKSIELGRVPIQDLYHLSPRAAMAKMASVSFYYGGIDLEAFKHCFNGATVESTFGPEVDFLLTHGLMYYTPDGTRLQMTKAGKSHFGGVVALFYSPAVQEHILGLKGGEMFTEDPVTLLAQSASSGRPAAVTGPTAQIQRTRAESGVAANGNVDGDWSREEPDGTLTMSIGGVITRKKMVKNPVDYGVKLVDVDVPSNALSASEPHDHEPFVFGNILFGGPCNQKCTFCIGSKLTDLTSNNLRRWPLLNLDTFIQRIRDSKTTKIIFTGTSTDPQLYKYEAELQQLLRAELPGVHLSLHTNGILAEKKMHVFNAYDSCTMSINSFVPATYQKIHGTRTMPNLENILTRSTIPIKLSCVVTADNVQELPEYLRHVECLGIRRLALRHVYGDPQRWKLFPEDVKPTHFHLNNPVYRIGSLEITHWIFDSTSGSSLNLFSDGTLSEKYLLTEAPKVKKQCT